MPRFEVDIQTIYSDTVTVEAETPVEAHEKARRSTAFGASTYSEANIVDVRRLRMDYDEALFDAGLLS